MKRQIYRYSPEEIDSIISKLERDIESAPDWRLHITHKPNRLEISYVDSEGVHYLKMSDEAHVKLMKQLAQRDYNIKLLRKIRKVRGPAVAEREYEYLLKAVNDVYESMSEERKRLVVPLQNPAKIAQENWNESDYVSKKTYTDNLIVLTERGELVRSKSEKMIADKLHAMGVLYKYEKRLYIRGFGEIYPDFTIYDSADGKEFYFEHFGMIDDQAYRDRMLERINLYRTSGYAGRLLFTFETLDRPLDVREVEALIKAYNLNATW